MSIVYSAPNPLCNATIAEGKMLVALAASQGLPGGTLYVNPVASAGVNGGGLVPVDKFLEANQNFPTTQPIYLQLQVPGKPDFYTVGLVYLFVNYGFTIQEALV